MYNNYDNIPSPSVNTKGDNNDDYQYDKNNNGQGNNDGL